METKALTLHHHRVFASSEVELSGSQAARHCKTLAQCMPLAVQALPQSVQCLWPLAAASLLQPLAVWSLLQPLAAASLPQSAQCLWLLQQ